MWITVLISQEGDTVWQRFFAPLRHPFWDGQPPIQCEVSIISVPQCHYDYYYHYYHSENNWWIADNLSDTKPRMGQGNRRYEQPWTHPSWLSLQSSLITMVGGKCGESEWKLRFYPFSQLKSSQRCTSRSTVESSLGIHHDFRPPHHL